MATAESDNILVCTSGYIFVKGGKMHTDCERCSLIVFTVHLLGFATAINRSLADCSNRSVDFRHCDKSCEGLLLSCTLRVLLGSHQIVYLVSITVSLLYLNTLLSH